MDNRQSAAFRFTVSPVSRPFGQALIVTAGCACSTGNLFLADSFSETIVLPIEGPFIKARDVKDGIPYGLAWNSAAVDGCAAHPAGALNHQNTFCQVSLR
jgi:hypothetical protein